MTGFTKFLAVSALLVCLLTGVVTMSFDKEIAFASQSADGVGVVSARGVWHRPDDTGTEKDVAGVCAFLDKLQRAGINLVFLETFYHGMAMYRSTLVPYYTKFQSYNYGEYADYMSCFVAEADKRGIEVHAWVEDFYIGIEENYFTKNLPEWLLVTDKGSTRNTEGGGFIFLDPANAEVKNYLVSFYDELLTTFPTVAGLNLDYIRYPVSDQGDDTGYTQAAITAFCRQHNIDGSFTATEFAAYVKKNGLYSAWVDFRAAQVTDFVRTVFLSVRTKHPDKLLSTAIFPEPSLSYNTKKQDFVKWIEKGYIDIVTPMAYYDNPDTLKSALAEMIADCDKCFCYAGLSATYHNLSNAAVTRQLEVCNETGMDGFVFFGAKSLVENDSYVELLHKRFGTVSSVTP
uniref:glycoside hydrolase family 10 protein n=1 Tax=Candidatus Fimenecus sp. TaxID=3022888 RepID=UPI004027DDD4